MDGIYDEEENDMLEPAAEVRGWCQRLASACPSSGLLHPWAVPKLGLKPTGAE
jgi:hypothetical protein